MIARSWIRNLFARPPRTLRQAPARWRPRVEALEDRLAPATFDVNTLADTVDANPAVTSLREAITQANSQAGDDDIQFSVTGTINLSSVLPDLSSNIAIQGSGAGDLTVRRDSGGNYRIFTISSGAIVGLSGLTIANGLANVGGGILNDHGTLTVTGSTLSGNRADSDGGGILNAGALTVTGSTLSGNTTGRFGGGIFNGGTLTVTSSTLSGNVAIFGHGGGIDNRGTLTVTSSTLSGNSASQQGGGIIRSGSGKLTVTSSTLSGNSATSGGGIFNFFGTLTVTSSTLSGNSGFGGGIRNQAGALTLNNSIVVNSPPGGDVANSGTLTGSNNLIEAIINDGTITLTGTLTADPNLGDLADNGGPTWTHALLAGSPAINAGDNGLVPADVTTDQRGSGFARISGGTVDIGAFEVQNQAPTVSDFTKVGAEDNTLAFTAADFTGHYSDPDGDALAEVRIESLPADGTLKLDGVAVTAGQVIAAADLGGLTFEPGLNFSGSVTFQYTASDGVEFAASPATITLDIRSAAQQAAALQAQVAALRDEGVLNRGQANMLTSNLNLKGKRGDIDKVQQFLADVASLLNAGVLTQAQADALLGPGNILLLSVTRR